MTGHGAKFARKAEQAIAALLARPSLEDAARVAGVAEKTLRRWIREPEFNALYLQARRESVRQAIARIQQATGAAGATILKLMTDVNVPAAVRLRAAECVFGLAVKGIELEDIEARVSELERAAGGSANRR
jgi:hypothetical protein